MLELVALIVIVAVLHWAWRMDRQHARNHAPQLRRHVSEWRREREENNPTFQKQRIYLGAWSDEQRKAIK